MSLNGLKTRSKVVNAFRTALSRRGFEEYTPQLMSKTEPLEPTISPFKTQWNLPHQDTVLYLSTSPESYLKHILASGKVSKCFCVSHAFRNLEGTGNYHAPEFLMGEWYQQHASWHDMMMSTKEIICELWPETSTQSWPTHSLRKLWQQYEQTDLDALLTDEDMIQFAGEKGYTTKDATWEQLFYQIIFNDIEPHYPHHPFFLIDFPSRVSPLAKPQSTNSAYAERFELIINRVELANGNTENTNTQPLDTIIDSSLINSLQQMKSCEWAGVGLGIDRLAMMIGGISSIRDIQWI